MFIGKTCNFFIEGHNAGIWGTCDARNLICVAEREADDEEVADKEAGERRMIKVCRVRKGRSMEESC